MKKRKKGNFDIQVSKISGVRHMWFILGLISVGLGIAGYILPVMPGTTFMVIALYCFARSNKQWYNWLLTNKYFGKTIKDFKAGKGMSLKAKITALVFIVASITVSMLYATNFYVQIFLATCFVIAVSCILLQKTKKS